MGYLPPGPNGEDLRPEWAKRAEVALMVLWIVATPFIAFGMAQFVALVAASR